MLVYQRVCRNHPVMGVVLLVRPANALHFPVDRLSKRNQSIYKTPEKHRKRGGKARKNHGKTMVFPHFWEKPWKIPREIPHLSAKSFPGKFPIRNWEIPFPPCHWHILVPTEAWTWRLVTIEGQSPKPEDQKTSIDAIYHIIHVRNVLLI